MPADVDHSVGPMTPREILHAVLLALAILGVDCVLTAVGILVMALMFGKETRR